jgi:hypothetical protein
VYIQYSRIRLWHPSPHENNARAKLSSACGRSPSCPAKIVCVPQPLEKGLPGLLLSRHYSPTWEMLNGSTQCTFAWLVPKSVTVTCILRLVSTGFCENCSKIDFLRVFITFLRRSHDISIKMKKVGFMKTHLTNRKNV